MISDLRLLPVCVEHTLVERERERESDGETAGNDGRVLQEKRRVEEAPDAVKPDKARRSWSRSRCRRLCRLLHWRIRHQQAPSFFSPPLNQPLFPSFSDGGCREGEEVELAF